MVASLQNFLKELIRVSPSMGDCPYTPPPRPPSWLLAPTADVDPQQAEYLAARRGLFGPEAGPPSDDEKRKPLQTASGSGSGAATLAADAAGCRQGKEESKGEGVGDRANASPLTGSAIGAGDSGSGRGGEENGQSARDAKQRLPEKRWETPAEARERLEFRLQMVVSRMDVATAAAAATATMAAKAGVRRPEAWAVTAGKVARSAGVCTIHGRALRPEEAEAGGRPGVTW